MRAIDPRSSLGLALTAMLALQPRASLAAPDAAAPQQPSETFAIMKDGRKVPLLTEASEPILVAKVGTDGVTLGELVGALAVMHEDATGKAAAKDYTEVLDRLVAVRLSVLEAAAMGLTEKPDFKAAIAGMEDKFMREAVRRSVGATATADPKKVARMYRDATREWQIRTVMFEKDAEAKKLEAALAAGGKFEELAAKAIAAKTAKGGLEPVWMPQPKMSPEVAGILRKLKPGGTTPALQYGPGFAVMQVLGQRQVDSKDVRAKIESDALVEARVAEQKRFYKDLLARYAKVDRALLAKLDLAAKKPGLDALEKDKRVLATIQGGNPITVGDLVIELRSKFFHGAERQASQRKLNERKNQMFEDMLEKRLFTKEARARNLQDTYFIKKQVREFRDQLVLAAVVERVILPSVKVTPEELRKYYEAHKSDFTAPPMARLEAIAFTRAADAQKAMEKLRGGTDYKWLVQNADGKADPSKVSLQFDGSVTALNDLPPDLSKALAGTKTGDYRLWADPGGAHLVIRVAQAFPQEVQPYEGASETVEAKVRGQKINAAFQEWTGKLRQQYPVEILIARFGE
jgi:peptidyl-prolyl cis-trans isomerase SurA